MKLKIEIKNRWTGNVLFEFEKENNSLKDTLQEAVRQKADLRGAYLSDVNNIPFIPMACPSDGAFIGWKKVGDCLIELEIPAEARRSSATTSKCRCDKAKVISITNGEESFMKVTNRKYGHDTIYRVGEMVYPDSFDDNRWNECSHGIHFFINKQEAIDYEV